MCFKLCIILSSVIKDQTAPFSPLQDVTHSFVQHIHVLDATHPLTTQQPSGLSD